jgi:hypothetical protein
MVLPLFVWKGINPVEDCISIVIDGNLTDIQPHTGLHDKGKMIFSMVGEPVELLI